MLAPEATFQAQNATNPFSVRAPVETSTGEGLTTLTQAPKSDGGIPFKYPLTMPPQTFKEFQSWDE